MKHRQLNILLICKSLPWKFSGGIQTHVWELSQALVVQGHAVTILTGGPYRQAERAFDKEGITIREVPYFPGRYLKPVSILAEELSFNLAAREWTKNHHSAFDIIHAQGRSGYLLYMLGAVRHKLITTVHGLIAEETRHIKWYDLNSRIHTIFSSRVEKKLIEGSSECLAVSEDLKSDIHRQFHQPKLQVIPNGVRFQSEEPDTIGNKAARFLFVGRLHPVKGLFPLIEAMAYAPKHISLDIIGDGPQDASLKRLIEKKGLTHQVRLLGAHSNKSIHKTIPYYQALVLPSHYETQGIVLIEANAHAIPVIASNIPAIRETVEHGVNGLLCNPDDSHTFIEAMKELVKRPEEARQMGLRGRDRVIKHYSWDRIVNQTIAAYYKLAA